MDLQPHWLMDWWIDWLIDWLIDCVLRRIGRISAMNPFDVYLQKCSSEYIGENNRSFNIYQSDDIRLVLTG